MAMKTGRRTVGSYHLERLVLLSSMMCPAILSEFLKPQILEPNAYRKILKYITIELFKKKKAQNPEGKYNSSFSFKSHDSQPIS